MDIDQRYLLQALLYLRIVRILLNNGANLALHMSAQEGHLAVTKLLMKAGADLAAKTSLLQAPHRSTWLRQKGARRR